MLKITNKFNVLHTWIVSQGTLLTPMYNFKLKIRSFTKKLQQKYIIGLRGVCTTSLHFLTFVQVTGKWVNYSVSFFLAEHEYQSHSFLSRPAFPKLYVESLKRIINIGIFRHRLLMFDKVFQYFLGSQGGSHGKVRHPMNLVRSSS